MSEYSHLVPEHLRSLPAYVPGKAIQPTDKSRRPVKLASNENPFGPSPAALEAVADAISNVHLYPDNNAAALTTSLAAHHHLPSENILVTAGASSALQLLSRVLLGPGLNAIGGECSFISYPLLTRAANAEYRCAEMKDWGFDLEAIASLVDDKTRLIYLANPNNPTGSMIPAGELESFLDRLPEHVVVAVDEAYYDFAASFARKRGADYSRSEELVRQSRRVVVLRTFSKAQGLAALRVGYAMGSAELLGYMRRLQTTFEVSSIAQVAAIAALDDKEHYDKTLRNNTQQAVWLCEQLREMELEPVETWANFICVDVGEDAASVAKRLEEEGVSVRPLSGAWGARTSIRITIGSPDENRRFVEAFKSVAAAVR